MAAAGQGQGGVERDLDPDDPSTWPEGGMGLPIIRAACDELRYSSDGARNELTLRLTVDEPEEP